MYSPQAAKTSGAFWRKLLRFAGMRVPVTGRDRPGRMVKDVVDNQQHSWRMKKVSQRVVLWLMLPVMVFSLSWLGYTMLIHSDIFRMTSVSVQGNQVATQEQILKAAGLHRGANLLTLDTSRIEALIRQEQWVDQVWIKRNWPSTVDIVIREYKPFALINLERDGTRQLYYMNNKGVVFAPLNSQKDLDYPVVNGSRLADNLQGKQFLENSPGDMALNFLNLTAKGNHILPIQAISEINVEPESGLVVYLVDHPFPIYMGRDEMRLKFKRLVKVLAELYRDDRIKEVAEIRMDYADNKILVARVDEGK